MQNSKVSAKFLLKGFRWALRKKVLHLELILQILYLTIHTTMVMHFWCEKKCNFYTFNWFLKGNSSNSELCNASLMILLIRLYCKVDPEAKLARIDDLFDPHFKLCPVSCCTYYAAGLKNTFGKRRYRVCPIIHCCNSTTPYWITAPPILFYMVPCKEGHLCACNILGKHQPLVKRNISCESYEWALFIEVALFTNGSGYPGTIVLWRCQKVMRTS